ncbi:MAG: hypothetical protein ACOCVN_01545 [bacterium]
MEYRDLEKVRVIIKDATGLDISYAYDDLIFPDNTAFILQYDDQNNKNFSCYFHEDCLLHEQERILENLNKACQKQECSLVFNGSFFLEQNGQEVEIHFNKK